MRNIDKGTLVRTVILVLALVNQVLTVLGINPLPIDEGNLDLLISTAWTIVAAIWSWWKNNNITKEAVQAQVYLDDLKNNNL